MPVKNRTLIFSGCGLLTLTCLLYVTANILPLWGTYTSQYALARFGLWGGCAWRTDDSHPDWQCGDGIVGSITSYAKGTAARFFITIVCIISLLSIFSTLSILLVDDNVKSRMIKLTKILSAGSLIVGIIGVGLGLDYVTEFVTDTPETSFDPTASVQIHVSSVLAILAVVFNLLAAITSFLIKSNQIERSFMLPS